MGDKAVKTLRSFSPFIHKFMEISSPSFMSIVKEALHPYRVKRLVEKDIISPIRLEQALAEADVARLRVQQAKSRLLRAETNYSYTTITSPFEGYVDRIPFKVGSLVTPSSLLTSLTDVSEMFAYFKINEKEYLEYKRTQLSGVEQPEYNNLELILSDQTTYPYKGTVETVEGDFVAVRVPLLSCAFCQSGPPVATWCFG